MPRRVPRRSTRPSPRGPGRPTKLTPAVHAAIIDALTAGNFLHTAAEAAGVSSTSLHRWLQLGQDPDAPPAYREFWESATRARACAVQKIVAAAVEAAVGGAVLRRSVTVMPNGAEITDEQYAPPDGRVALKLLARMDPMAWAERAALEPTVAVDGDGGAVAAEVDYGGLADRLHERMQVRSSRVELPAGDVVDAQIVDPG